ncbi:glycosyltransferase [Macellibacteroides fermentans]|uniref:glycosyltransferase n=1 Tax=Macellibacteroides fermentans TaxID=879969 RepID=UPI00406D18DE
MKICIFTESIDKKDGGPSRSVPILSRGLSEVGIDTTLIATETENMNTHLLEGTEVKLIKVSKSLTSDNLEQIFRTQKFNLIHTQCIWVPLYHKACIAARKNGIPVVITPRGTLEPWSYQGQGFVRNLKKKIAMLLYQKNDLQKAACILATADMEAKNIRALGVKSPIAVIQNGIDVSEYQCRSIDDKTSVMKQVVFLSRIHQKKGIEFLINAWEQLKSKYPDWNVVIAGNGEESYIQQLKYLISKKDLQDCVKIIPPVFGEAKYKLYCESSLFVLPSYSENFGMVIAEAMSCGVPVITTNGTPWQELNVKKIGWCIDLSLKNIIATLSEAINLGQDRLFEMGQHCSQHIYDTYQYKEVAAKNKAVYEWIINGGTKPVDVI